MMEINYLPLKKINEAHADEIKQAVNKVLESGWYLKGKATEQFEQNYARFIGTSYCVGCGNGLDALWLIFRAYLELGLLHEGDEVLVPANTYIASILAITENHLKPVLVEPNINTLQIDDQLIEQAITNKTHAIMIVHLYGRCAMTPRIEQCCKEHHLLLIEDNAQAHGCHYHGKRTGALGSAAGHSFYPGKNLGALGDAGAVTTNNKELADAVRAIANYGSARKYVFNYKGINSRIDELQAAVLNVKLRYLDQENEQRRKVATCYYAHLNNPFVTLPTGKQSDNDERDCVFHIFPVLSAERDALQQYLKACGIGCIIHYPIPPHKQQCYSEWRNLHLPVTEAIHQQELSLPCHQLMSNEEIEYVIEMVNEFQP